MKVCYFGDYVPTYPRHIVLQRGLRQAGAEVVEVQLKNTGFRKYFEIVRRLNEIPKDADLILVAYSNSRFVWFLRLLTKKRIVWNAFYSIYNNWVFDRKRVKQGSFRAQMLWLQDYLCCIASDLVILETNADIKYFSETFSLDEKKFHRVFIGYDEEVFYPRLKERAVDNKFVVEFHGNYIPLQGVPVIIQAAKLLESQKDIHFNLIGDGQTYPEVKKLAQKLAVKNVTFFPRLSPEEIVQHINLADVCIGLIGDVSRVNQCIPNKLLEASAMKRACINADTDAIKEMFVDGEDVILIEKGNPNDLAAKILELRDNDSLKNSIAEAAHKTVVAKAGTGVIGRELYNRLRLLV